MKFWGEPMENEIISNEHMILTCTAIFTGTLARVLTIKEDIRQYPSYPNGYMINLVTGFIASALGAVAVPALMTKNFVAVTFLTIAVQQFRDVRKAERESLKDLEKAEFTFRGNAYIDGISKTFEARNYFSLIVSLVTAITMEAVSSETFYINMISGLLAGLFVLYFLSKFSKGKTIGDIAQVLQGEIEIRDSSLFVNGLYVTNLIGTENATQLFQDEGLAVVIKPNEHRFRVTLDHYGQRQAALFEAARAIGVKRFHFTRKNFDEGDVIITLVPLVNDIDRMIEAVKKTPLLESTRKNKDVLNTNMAGRDSHG